jgi:hypothetical protein
MLTGASEQAVVRATIPLRHLLLVPEAQGAGVYVSS